MYKNTSEIVNKNVSGTLLGTNQNFYISKHFLCDPLPRSFSFYYFNC